MAAYGKKSGRGVLFSVVTMLGICGFIKAALADAATPSFRDSLPQWGASFSDTEANPSSPLAEENERKESTGQESLSFNDARMDEDTSPLAGQAVADTLIRAVKNAGFSTLTVKPDNNNQYSTNGMKARLYGMTSLKNMHPSQSGNAVSYMVHPREDLVLSFSGAFLKEKNVTLESADNKNFGLSKTNTYSVGVGASVKLGKGYTLGADVVAASTAASPGEASLITNTNSLSSFGLGMALDKDNMGFSVQKPLRIYAGSAQIGVPAGVDANGNQIIQSREISMEPSGSETDFGVSYKKPMDFGGTGSFSLTYRHDADNISGAHEGVALFHFAAAF